MLTDGMIYKETGQYDKEVIRRLHLPNHGISRIGNLEPCVSLVELVLSYNDIGFISGLDSLVSLQVLDLSFNRIRRVENLGKLVALESLDLRGNQIGTLDDLAEVNKLPNLQCLILKGVDGEDANPVCGLPSYSTEVMRWLPSLQVLDGGHVKIRDAFGSIEDDLARLRPDPTISETPPLEPWFSDQDLAGFDGEGSGGKPSKHAAAVEEAEGKIRAMLAEDCSHLLRKATAALSKMGKP